MAHRKAAAVKTEATVRIAPMLRAATGGEQAVLAEGSNVGEVLRALTRRHPRIQRQLFRQDGSLNSHVNVYLNEVDVRGREGLRTPVKSSDRLLVLPALGPVREEIANVQKTVGPTRVDRLDLEPDDPAERREIDIRMQAINGQLIRLLAEQPDRMYRLRPRQLEELMAELYARQGFDVQLTPETHDGGVDLYVVCRTPFGRLLTLVDTKRHGRGRPVGVGIVRQLYGVVEAKRASAGVVATTSFFTRDARRFQEEVPFRLALQDYVDLRAMVQAAAARQR
jgi:molybdopterin converting factor small subunit